MNLRWNDHPILLQVLLAGLLFLILITLSYLFALIQPAVSGMELFARANSTRTSIALTSQALMGPFPTATGPTPTPSETPSITPTPTVTPTATPTRTPVRYFIDTATPRTLVPQQGTPGPTATQPPPATRTPIPPPQQPTNPPPQVTNPPRPTSPPSQPTNPPRKATKTPKPPKPTKTPKK